MAFYLLLGTETGEGLRQKNPFKNVTTFIIKKEQDCDDKFNYMYYMANALVYFNVVSFVF